MKKMEMSKWAPLAWLTGIFIFSMAFTNCSDMSFQQSKSSLEKTDGQAVEVVDTTGMDGEPLSEENEEDIKEELKHRRDQQETEIAHTDADGCGSNKVIVCHVPPGNPENAHDICISVNALHAHVGRHGAGDHLDHVGSCQSVSKIEVADNCKDKKRKDAEDPDTGSPEVN